MQTNEVIFSAERRLAKEEVPTCVSETRRSSLVGGGVDEIIADRKANSENHEEGASLLSTSRRWIKAARGNYLSHGGWKR